ncbi:Hypothetical protein A7982_05901 [Minicystis rosea]|nr:Hypothetical protein A7982_05901 [Minicystis rosea]
MANKLGAAFLRCSLGPLNYAGGCILSSKVENGLSELSTDNLHGGLKRGVEETARQAGVGVADVERLLPMAEINACAGRLDLAQKNALQAWRMYAGHLGGLMKGVADLTVDGRAPDVSHFLARLAKKVVRDRPLSEPLDALSVEVASWLDIIEKCSELIGDGGVLARAYRRRRMQRVAIIGAAGVVCASAIGVVIWIHAVRARVGEALAATDPCTAVAINPDDLARASSEQQKLADERKAACEAVKRREAEARAEQEKREAERREAEQRKAAHAAQCEALAEHLAAGSISPADTAGMDAAALLERVAKSALESADLVVADLPCKDTASSKKIEDAYATAVCASTMTWSRPDEVSERVYEALVAKKDALPGSPKQVLGQHADRVAMKAIVSKDDAAKARAMRICQLKDDLGMRGGKYCSTLFVLAGKR